MRGFGTLPFDEKTGGRRRTRLFPEDFGRRGNAFRGHDPPRQSGRQESRVDHRHLHRVLGERTQLGDEKGRVRRTLDVGGLLIVVVDNAASSGGTPFDVDALQLVAANVFALGQLPAHENGRRAVLLKIGR